MSDELSLKNKTEPDTGSIRTVGLLGGGVIGGGWASRFLLNGIDVKIFDPDPEAERKVGEVLTLAKRAWADLTDAPMRPLPPAEQEHTRKAICLLRLARALNLGRSDSVRAVKIHSREANVKLTLVPKRGMGADLELWAIEKDQLYFRELFGRTLSATAL